MFEHLSEGGVQMSVLPITTILEELRSRICEMRDSL
ncbi:MAG: hypothetical protein XD80_0042 [Synergistales bacterium 53_16]|jgi:hypothetical protein|nr:MAG: hypothetical protein XD80_0042 [Synergistales bacterium 53_16]KUL04956.1 MAG: hypothetical protein XE12_0212 [Synergistales bacterium 54_9]